MVSQPIDETKMEDGLVDNTEPASKYHGLETLKVVEEYIKKCKDDEHFLPTVEGIALELDVNVDTLYKWAKRYLAFRNLRDKVLLMQKQRLMNAVAFGGKFANAGGGIFLLKANHGMIETSKNLIGNADGSNIDTLRIYKPIKLKEGEGGIYQPDKG